MAGDMGSGPLLTLARFGPLRCSFLKPALRRAFYLRSATLRAKFVICYYTSRHLIDV